MEDGPGTRLTAKMLCQVYIWYSGKLLIEKTFTISRFESFQQKFSFWCSASIYTIDISCTFSVWNAHFLLIHAIKVSRHMVRRNSGKTWQWSSAISRSCQERRISTSFAATMKVSPWNFCVCCIRLYDWFSNPWTFSLLTSYRSAKISPSKLSFYVVLITDARCVCMHVYMRTCVYIYVVRHPHAHLLIMHNYCNQYGKDRQHWPCVNSHQTMGGRLTRKQEKGGDQYTRIV